MPNPGAEGYICPAFDPGTSQCRIYHERPVDCQIYPLALMWSRDGNEVLLGWDSKCPFLDQDMRERDPSSSISRRLLEEHAERVAHLVEQGDLLETLTRHPRLVGRFQEDVVIWRSLSRLTARLRANRKHDLARVDPLAVRPFSLGDAPRLAQAVHAIDTPLATYALAPHFIWKELFVYSWTEIAGHFCLFAEYADGLFMPLPPLSVGQGQDGDEAQRQAGPSEPGQEFADALAACFAWMRSRNEGSTVSRVENVPEDLTAYCRALGYAATPKDPDYLYRADDLVALAGDRYKSQRAACNRFIRSQSYQVQPYQDRDFESCLELFETWAEQKRSEGIDGVAEQMLRDSASAHRLALGHHRELGLTGMVLRIAGKVGAYTFGYPRSADVFCVLLEVADREKPGLAQFLFRELCRKAAQGGATFINTMDDSGLPSLLRSKRGYRPIRLVENMVVFEPHAGQADSLAFLTPSP